MSGDPVLLYDTTLRDGAQREGLVLSLQDKLRIARALDEFGMPAIEGGWPGSNPKDIEFFAAAKKIRWERARLAAFGSTRHKSNRPGDDPNLNALLDAETPIVTIFGKSWTLHVDEVLETSRAENLAMIAESIGYMTERGREAVYDAEHFFDGYEADNAYALDTLRAARDAGASTLVLCDTNGGTLTGRMATIVRDAAAALAADPGASGKPIVWGIHTHNDAELAVANALAAVDAGVRHVQATINGYGERAGNANIVSLLANLALKTPYAVAGADRLSELSGLSHAVAEIANLAPDDHQPYVGRSAFAHKGGVHGAAQVKTPRAYQHIDPAIVGNRGRLVVSELGGKANAGSRAAELGVELADSGLDSKALSNLVKELESEGASYEGAEASFELLVERHRPDYVAPFQVLDFTVVVERRDGTSTRAEATVKVEVNGEQLHTASDGSGPVNALDRALRKALGAFYPQLDAVHLVDYKVRILDGASATAAKTRVVIESVAGGEAWSTMGVGENIIAASATALADSLEYALRRSGGGASRRSER
ncbi:MAG: citramalate synthase, partial [Chloroflexi bacterium]